MKQIIVTTSWDDGHKDDMLIAALLHKYHLTGTFYIAPNNREFAKTTLLSAQQIVYLNSLFEIGGHTLHHYDLTTLEDSEVVTEIVGGKRVLEHILNNKLLSFSYPYGRYTNRTKELVKQTGFLLARTTSQMSTSLSTDTFTVATTVELSAQSIFGIYGHFKQSILTKNFTLLPYLSLSWIENLRTIFDYVYEHGGVYHLWGHSWMLRKRQLYNELEQLFSYITDKPGITYVTNSELLTLHKYA